MENMMNTALLGLLGPLFLWVFKKAAGKITDIIGNFLEKKTQSQYVGDTIKRLDETAMRVVKSVYQSYVSGLKNERKGRLTADEKNNAMNLALAKLKSYLGPKGLEEVKKIFNLKDGAIDRLLGDTIEASVFNAKKA